MIEQEFERFRGLVQELIPESPAFLPGASEDDLTLLAAELGQPVPEELARMLRVSAGQDPTGDLDGPLNLHRLLTVDEIQRTHRLLRDAVSDIAIPAGWRSWYSDRVWSAGWIPFAGFIGDAIVVDVDPGPRGRRGQVFTRWNVPEEEAPQGRSLTEFFRKVNDGVEAGSIPVVDGTFEWTWDRRGRLHAFDE